MTQDEFDILCSKTNATYNTDGNYSIHCPCHADSDPSCSIKLKDSKLLVNCWVGCDRKEIYKALIELLPKRQVLTQKEHQDSTFHEYYNADGSYYGRSVRKYYIHNGERAKKMYSLKYDALTRTWAKGSNGKTIGLSAKTAPLYGLIPLLNSSKTKAVFIVEGETKVDELLKHGLIAVCNQGGAKKWSSHHNVHLLGRTCILVPDNDTPGHEHVSITAAMLRESGITDLRLLELPGLGESEDVVDYLQRNTIDDFKALARKSEKFPELETLTTVTKQLETIVQQSDGTVKKRSTSPTSADYQQVFQKIVPVRKDLFSNEGMYYDHTISMWTPVLNRISTYKVEIQDLLATGCPLKFKTNAVEDNLKHYIQGLAPEFLVDIPEWDGVDRLQAMANAVEFDPMTKMDGEMFGYFLKDWYCKAFKRAFHPEVQNRMIVLQGSQGAGKDFFASTLIKGLGQFASEFAVTGNNDKDMYLQLSNNMVLRIGEFDKTSKMHVSILKDIITNERMQIRGSYEKKAVIRPSRASFISTANVQDILRDYTGNRRYLVFFIKKINWNYPSTPQDSAQVMAQAYHYSINNWTESEGLVVKAEHTMDVLVSALTPENPEDIVIETWVDQAKKIVGDWDIGRDLTGEIHHLDADQASSVLKIIRERTGYSDRSIRTILNRRGFRKVAKINGVSTRVFLTEPQENLNFDTGDATAKDHNIILRKLDKLDVN